jgi:hypothetical protein
VRAIRAIAFWATLGAIGLLAALSIAGTFLGAAGAKALFNSPPLVVFWFLVLALLAACFFVDVRLVRSFGLTVLHLGSLVLLAGAMWGSDLGHLVANKVLGRQKHPYGVMVIHEGTMTDQLLDPKTNEPIGRLPFSVGLEDFRIEYYPTDRPWDLWFGRPVAPDADPNSGLSRLAWKVGEESAVEGTAVRVRVLQYLPHARAVRDAEGKVVGAEADASSEAPAMEVEVALRDRAQKGWLVPAPGEEAPHLAMDGLVPKEVAAQAGLALWLARPRSMPKDYLSDLAVLEGGQVAARKTIEVNRPLSWRGYHFYQYSYDDKHNRYTVLTVRSDSGWTAVRLGLVLLAAGTFVRCWNERAWMAADRRRAR